MVTSGSEVFTAGKSMKLDVAQKRSDVGAGQRRLYDLT